MFVLIIVNTENDLSLSSLVAAVIINNSFVTFKFQERTTFSPEKDLFVINSNAHVSPCLIKQGKWSIQYDEVEIIPV